MFDKFLIVKLIVVLNFLTGLPTKEYFRNEQTRAEAYRNRYFALNAFERHKKLINDYFLYHPGAAEKVLKRDE